MSDRAQGLVVSDQGLRQLVGAMVASRQLYAMAIHDLDARLDSEKIPYTDISDEDRSPLKEIFYQFQPLLKLRIRLRRAIYSLVFEIRLFLGWRLCRLRILRKKHVL